ncbi:MAG: Cof-type HAD-IIB family hydrolase [Lachnospiraceae bacterium]|nr:Cof-type HAD-IIB family hydrolase [Lachnospiraceae bacterium]
MVDLHVHSNRSDGTYTVKELVDYAIQKNLSAMALTDHDTVDGIDEMLAYAESLRASGAKGVPEIIPGIELSTDLDNKDVHVVGLYVNHKSPAFVKYLQDFVDSREKRNEKMCLKLQEYGVDITYEELLERFPGAVITRAHFARLMMEKGFIRSMVEAFDKYIGDRRPCYIPRDKVTPEDAVKLILAADGIPVLAHPILYHMSDEKLEALVRSLKAAGLIGIEAVYSTYSPSEERDIRKLADKYRLRISGGSDFHGSNKVNIDLGTGLGKLCVEDSVLEELKGARKNILFTDMDGTLLLNDSTISEDMLRGLHKLDEAGHCLVLTSGRPLPSILERIELFGFGVNGEGPEYGDDDSRVSGLHNLYVIANNGGILYDCGKKEIISAKKLEPDLITTVVNMALEAGLHVHAYTDKEIVGFTDDEEQKYYRSRIHMPLILTNDIAKVCADGTYKVQIISLTDHEALVKLRARIDAALSDRVDTVFACNEYLEILPKGIDKGRAILDMTDYLAMPRSHTYAAGDAENDLGMIRSAAHGIAMANACDILKESAEIITERDNNHDGLLEIIDKYFN